MILSLFFILKNMIILNDLSINNTGNKIFVNVQTTETYNITSVLLWTDKNFKDYTLAKDLSYKLEQVNNKEIFTIDASEVGLTNYTGIYFLEFETDAPNIECSTCPNPLLGIVYNLTSHYRCISNILLGIDNCLNCNHGFTNNPDVDKAITIDLMLNAINYSLEIGNYIEAISLLPKLEKLCNSLKCCKNLSTVNSGIKSNCLNCTNGNT